MKIFSLFHVVVGIAFSVLGCVRDPGESVTESPATVEGSNVFTLGGQIIGLNGLLVLSDGEINVELRNNGSFVFRSGLASGHPFQIGISGQPSDQNCSILNAAGVIKQTDVNSLVIICGARTPDDPFSNGVVVDAGADQMNGTVGAVIQLDGTRSRTGAATNVRYTWSLVPPANSKAVLENSNTAQPRFIADITGDYVAQLTVTIDGAAQPVDYVQVKVNNHRPAGVVTELSGVNFYVGNKLDLGASGSTDQDGDPLSFFWSLSAKPASSNISLLNERASVVSFLPDVPGVYEVQLVVNDGKIDSIPLKSIFVVNRTPNVGNGVVVFADDLNHAIPAQIKPGAATLADAQGFSSLGPDGNTFGNTFLRSATSNVVTLELSGLPVHNYLNLDFLFAAIDSLDGTGSFPAGDFFKVTVDGVTVFRESFANATPDQVQSYIPPPGGELARHRDLGFSGPGSYFTDSAYDFSVEPKFHGIAHSASSVVITFEMEGVGLQDITDESWAMDNLVVSVQNISSQSSIAFLTKSMALGRGLQDGPYTVRLPSTKHGGTTVRIEARDSSRVLIAPNATTAGSAFIDVMIPDGIRDATYYVAALEGATGDVAVAATIAGGAADTAVVRVVTPAIMLFGLKPRFLATDANAIFMATIGVPDDTMSVVRTSQFVRIGGQAVGVTFSNSSDTVAQLVAQNVAAQTQSLSIPVGQYQTSAASSGVYFDPLSDGNTSVSVRAQNFVSTAAADQGVVVSLAAIQTIGSVATVGKDLQILHSVSLSAIPGAPTDVVITSDNANVALAPNALPDRNNTGTQALTFKGVRNLGSLGFYIQGLVYDTASPTSTLTVSAQGYSPLKITVTITPSGFWIIDPTTIVTSVNAANTTFYVQPVRLDPTNLSYAGTQALRGGITPVVDFVGIDSRVGNVVMPKTTIPIVSAVFSSSDPSSNKAFEFAPVGAGKISVSISTPTGFSTPQAKNAAGAWVPANQLLDIAVN